MNRTRPTITVFGPFSHLHYRPCPECGASVAGARMDVHECEPDRRLDYQLFQLRGEVAALETDLRAYLESPRGRFELWYAERCRRSRLTDA